MLRLGCDEQINSKHVIKLYQAIKNRLNFRRFFIVKPNNSYVYDLPRVLKNSDIEFAQALRVV